jgi:ubiquinone/menaquinone biosynthesis C-methylase UbiE
LKETQLADWKDKRNIMQQYDATSKGYDELHGEEQNAKYQATLKNVNVAGGVVLDVGCGSGLFFKEVTDKAKLVVGVDFSRNLLLLAKDQAYGLGNVFVVQSDADHLPFVDGLFDGVFAFTVLQNMPQFSVTLDEWRRVTKKNGKAVVTALKKAFSLPAFLDLLDAAGFEVLSFVDDEALKCYVSAVEIKRLASAT